MEKPRSSFLGGARARRGFTLAELMVSSVITSIILIGVAAAFTGVQGSYQAETRIKASTEGARTALGFIEKQLKLAGYGIDPRYVFDMDAASLPGNVKNNFVFMLGQSTDPWKVVTDDLAYRFRDPSYLRRGSLSGTTLTIEALTPDTSDFGVPLKKGQALMVSCSGGQDYVVVRTADVVETAATTANVTAPVAPFPTAMPPCLSLTGGLSPFIMIVHERRLRVEPIQGVPFLVAFHNFDMVIGNEDYDPIASGVDNFQVAYVMARPSPSSVWALKDPPDLLGGNANWILGDAMGEQGPDPAAAPVPTYRLPYDDISRYSPHPANIRMIRMSVGMRSEQPEPNARRAFEERTVEDNTVYNSPGTPPDGYYRTVMKSAVRIPNMLSRSMFTPVLRFSAGDPAELNSWGG